MHPTSLPGPYAIGDIGPAAYRFADQLAACGQSWWLMLPICPVGPGDAPYNSTSSFAISPLLISPDRLVEQGLLDIDDVRQASGPSTARTDYNKARRIKSMLLRKAFERFRKTAAFNRFAKNNEDWLNDHCTFSDNDTDYEQFVQFTAHRQWNDLRRYCNKLGIGLMGDVPIYVACDSADVRANRSLFQLKHDGSMTRVSGAPPDAFCRNGQKWGHPLYKWNRHRDTGFEWWVRRMSVQFDRFDALRIDHFIGLHRYWSVPVQARNARKGRWQRGPGADLFNAIFKAIPDAQFIVEDLGKLTRGAKQLRDQFNLPGMRVLQDGFGLNSPYHLPHRYKNRFVAYTGTHDTDTTIGWFRKLSAERRRHVLHYAQCRASEVHLGLIRLAMSSVADTAIIPLQDVLGLGTSARMNIPGQPRNQWRWRMKPDAMTDDVIQGLRELTETYERTAHRRKSY